MSQTQESLYIVLIIAIVVIATLLALVLFRLFQILRDLKQVTESARKTGKVAEVLATRIIGPISAVIGTGAGVRKGAEILLKKRQSKNDSGNKRN